MKYVAMLFLVFVAVWCGCPAEEGRYFADGDGVWRVVGPTHVHDWEVGPWRNFTNATELIQDAIDAAFRAGGGTVRLSKGSYPIRGIRLRSRITLHLESGAALLASRDSADFRTLQRDTVEPIDVAAEAAKNASWRSPKKSFIRDALAPWNDAIIRIHNARDVASTLR